MNNGVLVEVCTDKGKYKLGDEVLLSITIGNLSPNPIELAFKSSQHYEFIISKDGKELWHWSSDKMFAMVLESLILQTRGRRTYTETWKPENANIGKYEVSGRITSQPAYKAMCTFEFNNT